MTAQRTVVDLSKSFTSRDRHFTHGCRELHYNTEGKGRGLTDGPRQKDQVFQTADGRRKEDTLSLEKTSSRWSYLSKSNTAVCNQFTRSEDKRPERPTKRCPPERDKEGQKHAVWGLTEMAGSSFYTNTAVLLLRAKVNLGTCCLRDKRSNKIVLRMKGRRWKDSKRYDCTDRLQHNSVKFNTSGVAVYC